MTTSQFTRMYRLERSIIVRWDNGVAVSIVVFNVDGREFDSALGLGQHAGYGSIIAFIGLLFLLKTNRWRLNRTTI